MRVHRKRLCLDDPVAQDLWAQGKNLKEIALIRGLPYNGINSTWFFGTVDPTPQPLGCPPLAGRHGETDEARAFRRFPITSHKPGRLA
jgi:hypothetical protein